MSRLAAPLLCLFVFLCAGTAQAGFAPGNDPIVEAEQLSAAIATDPGGNSLVVWSQQPTLGAPDEVKARRLAADGTLGPVIPLSPTETADQPKVAMAPSGRAFVAWSFRPEFTDPNTVKGRWVEPDGTLGPLLTLTAGEAGNHDPIEVKVAVDPAGVATVIWRDQSDGNKLGLRRVSPASLLGPAVPDISGGGGAIEAEIAGLPNGSSVVVWRSSGIEGNVVDANLEFGAPFAVSAPSLAAGPALAVDSAGNGLVAWRGQTGEEFSIGGRLLAPTGLPAGGEFEIDPAGSGSIGLTVGASADSLGDFLVSWSRRIEVNKDTVFARGINAAGAFAGPAQPLSAPGFDNDRPATALVDAGIGAAAWSSTIGEESTLQGRTLNREAVPLTAAQQLFGESFGPEEVGNAPATGVAAFLVEYAVSGSAQGALVQRFMVPPTCAPSTAAVVGGNPISIPISCTGPAQEGAQVTEQPRHGTLGAFNPLLNGFTYTPRPGYEGSDGFAYVGLNDGGASTPARVTIAVGKATLKPRIGKPRIKKLRFIRKGKKFRLVFSEPARAVIRVKKVRRVNGKRKIKLIGRVSSRKASRKATVKVRGKLKKRLLAGGRFRAIAVATDVANGRSKAKRISFKLNG